MLNTKQILETSHRKILISGLLLFCFSIHGARAEQSVSDVVNGFLNANNFVLSSAGYFQERDHTNSWTAINQALANLQGLKEPLSDPGVASALGAKATQMSRQLPKLESKVWRLASIIGSQDPGSLTYRQRKSVINRAQAVAKDIQKLANKAGRPLLVENNSSAGFHTPGQLVRFSYSVPAGCGQAPQIRVINQFNSPAVESYSYSQNTILVRMGGASGGSRVEVTACGVTTRRLLYNYGKAPISGVPEDFPSYLPRGNYNLTVGGSITSSYTDSNGHTHTQTVPISSVTYGPYYLSNLPTFARWLVAYFQRALYSAAQQVSSSGCGQSFHYSPFIDNAFTATYTIQCTSGSSSAATTMSFTLARI